MITRKQIYLLITYIGLIGCDNYQYRRSHNNTINNRSTNRSSVKNNHLTRHIRADNMYEARQFDSGLIQGLHGQINCWECPQEMRSKRSDLYLKLSIAYFYYSGKGEATVESRQYLEKGLELLSNDTGRNIVPYVLAGESCYYHNRFDNSVSYLELALRRTEHDYNSPKPFHRIYMFLALAYYELYAKQEIPGLHTVHVQYYDTLHKTVLYTRKALESINTWIKALVEVERDVRSKKAPNNQVYSTIQPNVSRFIEAILTGYDDRLTRNTLEEFKEEQIRTVILPFLYAEKEGCYKDCLLLSRLQLINYEYLIARDTIVYSYISDQLSQLVKTYENSINLFYQPSDKLLKSHRPKVEMLNSSHDKIISNIDIKKSSYNGIVIPRGIAPKAYSNNATSKEMVQDLITMTERFKEAYVYRTAKEPGMNKNIVTTTMSSIFAIKTEVSLGSGFFINEKGFGVTSLHILCGQELFQVILKDGTNLTGQLVKANINSDLALIQVGTKNDNITYLPLVKVTEEKITTEVMAIGSPKLLELSHSVSKGIISGIREINGLTIVQTDAPINPGNSGGPLINESGECYGIIVSKIIGSGIEGLGFAVASQDVMKSLDLKFID